MMRIGFDDENLLVKVSYAILMIQTRAEKPCQSGEILIQKVTMDYVSEGLSG